MKKTVLVLNIDTVKSKNMYQFNAMRDHGYTYAVFSYGDPKVSIPEEENAIFSFHKYSLSLMARFIQVLCFFVENYKKIGHVELYMGGGSFLFIEFLLTLFFNLPLCVVERGSPLKDIEKYGFFGRRVRKLIYKKAGYVWIRELWMKESLRKIGREEFFFLPNAIAIPEKYNFSYEKEIGFVWCNTLKKWRNIEWLIDGVASSPFLRDQKIQILGLVEDNDAVKKQQEYVRRNKTPNIDLLPFQDPEFFFLNAKFFVLPADIVYLNFSLIEAMAYGVVPIVSDVEGAREIVDAGVNGLVVSHDKTSFCEGMIKALKMDKKNYEELSRNARLKVMQAFSIEAWSDALFEFYTEMEN